MVTSEAMKLGIPAMESSATTVSPLLEMTMSMQFASVAGLRTPHLGLLWSQLRERYPTYTDSGPMPPVFELFGGPLGTPQPQFSFQMSLPVPRVSFESASRSFVLHVQQDRIMLTWQRFPAEAPYPGYEEMRAMLVREIEVIAAFLDTEGLGQISPNQCELTYINAITLPGEGAVHEHLERVTPAWNQVDVGLPFETATLQNRYLILSGEAPIGRLYTTFSPAYLAATEQPNYQLELVARARPESESLDSAFALFDRSHDLIRCAFDRVTTSLVRTSGEE